MKICKHCGQIIHKGKGAFVSFKLAKEFVSKLNLKGQSEWGKYAKGEIKGLPKKPKNIPADVVTYYKDKGWTDWYDFLGKSKHLKVKNRSVKPKPQKHVLRERKVSIRAIAEGKQNPIF